jgi:hypothetical protein
MGAAVAVFVQEKQTTTVRWVPPSRATAATAVFVAPSGSELGTLTPTLDATSRPVATATNAFSATLGAGTGALVAGREYWLQNPKQGEALVRVATVDGATFSLSDTPAVPLEAGCVFFGAELQVTLTPALTDKRGILYRIDWAIDEALSGDQVRGFRQVVHICRQLFAPAMTPQRVAQYVGAAFPHASKRPFSWFADLAERAAQQVERRLLSSGRLPQLIGDHDLFADCGIIALRLQLALEGLVPAGFDPSMYQDQQEKELTRQLDFATANQWEDENDDGRVSADEFRPFTSISARLA